MAYQTGTAASLSALRTQIRSFLSTAGLTVTAGDVIHDGANLYIALAYNANKHESSYDTLDLTIGTGESSGSLTGGNGETYELRERFGQTTTDGDVVVGFPITYHLFYHAASNNFAAVIVHNTAFIQWLGFGEIDKLGTWTGGVWAGASFGAFYSTGTSQNIYQTDLCYMNASGIRANGYGFWLGTDGSTATNNGNMTLRCDIDGTAGDWLDNSEDNTPSMSGSRLNTYHRWLGLSDFNAKAHLTPILVAVQRASSKLTVAGSVPFARHVYVKNHAIGDIITLGADQWMLFPHIRWTDHDISLPTDGQVVSAGTRFSSGNYGFAIAYDGP